MTIVTVGLGARSYDIVIEAGLLARAGTAIAALGGNRRIAVVTDAHVAALHLPGFAAALAAAGLTAEPIVLPPGEASKDWRTLETVTERLLALGVERGDVIVALGGGVIGDLTGFAAAILRTRRALRTGADDICSPRSTVRSAARPRSTRPPARTWSAPSTNRRWC